MVCKTWFVTLTKEQPSQRAGEGKGDLQRKMGLNLRSVRILAHSADSMATWPDCAPTTSRLAHEHNSPVAFGDPVVVVNEVCSAQQVHKVLVVRDHDELEVSLRLTSANNSKK